MAELAGKKTRNAEPRPLRLLVLLDNILIKFANNVDWLLISLQVSNQCALLSQEPTLIT